MYCEPIFKKKLNLIWKRVKKSTQKNRPQDYEEKKAALEDLKTQEKKGLLNLYYADGSGFSLVPSVPYAWQEKGKRIELPCFRSPTLNLFGIWDAKQELTLFSTESNLNSEIVIAFIDSFCKDLTGRNVLVIDNASIHTSQAVKDKEEQWQKQGLELFYLPAYSPHLNLIEHLWRFMKYEWIEFSAYDCWNNLVNYVEKIEHNFGELYTINFE